MGFGAIILNFIGACVRWLFGSIWRTIFEEKKFTFNEYLNGPENSDDWFDLTGHVFVNKIIGIISLFITLMFLMSINI
jgi:hypothetical protein